MGEAMGTGKPVEPIKILQPKKSLESIFVSRNYFPPLDSPAKTTQFGLLAATYSNASFEDSDIQIPSNSKRANWPEMRIVIAGAGIAGLSSAIALHSHGFTDITILERTKSAQDAGAGIQVAPNMSRLLRKWGCLECLRKNATPLSEIQIRRWEDNAVLGSTPLMPEVEHIHGAPLWVVHRKDLSDMLRRAVLSCGIQIRYDSQVSDLDLEATRLKSSDGSWIYADAILAGDGVKSDLRKLLLLNHNQTSVVIDTGDAAYRLLIPRSVLEPYPEYLPLLQSNSAIRWVGPGSHIMLYPICDHSVLNVVLIHPDISEGSRESWSAQGDRDTMLKVFSSWNPFVAKLISLAPGLIFKWKLRSHSLLKTWIGKNMALIGDAAHPMLPYVAQGASQSMEDGAVIASCLASARAKDDVSQCLKRYEDVRKIRAEKIQLSALQTREALHLPDGALQRERDDTFTKISNGGRNADLWGDPEWQRFMWTEDVTHGL